MSKCARLLKRSKRAEDYVCSLADQEMLCEERPIEETKGKKSVESEKHTVENKSISVILTDPEVLDCTVCFENLNIPVFQCENGHLACNSCCVQLQNICPTCSNPIGHIRCRAIEKVIESLVLPRQNAKYGCRETVSYSKKKEHGNVCMHAPCSCPLCDFVDSCEDLQRHFSLRHKTEASAVRFTCNKKFTVYLFVEGQKVVLQHNNGALFILHNDVVKHLMGNAVYINRIAPNSSKGRFTYEVSAKFGEERYVRFQACTKNIQDVAAANASSAEVLLIPSAYFAFRVMLEFQIRIK